MAAFLSLTLNCSGYPFSSILNAAQTPTSVVARNTSRARIQSRARYNHRRSLAWASQLDEFEPRFSPIVNKIDQEPEAEDEVDNVGVKAALSMLKFYKSAYMVYFHLDSGDIFILHSLCDERRTRVLSVGLNDINDFDAFLAEEISPLLPKSCRYLPTCSEYSMIAYKKYGVVKGTVLTAWRLCRCNPLGGSGFDPARWFDEEPTADE